MTDRSSTIQIGDFKISTDRDHRGRYRGNQTMGKNFRGWHYHIEHSTLTQNELFNLLSGVLRNLGAKHEAGIEYVDFIRYQPNVEKQELKNEIRSLQQEKNRLTWKIPDRQRNKKLIDSLSKKIAEKQKELTATVKLPYLTLANPKVAIGTVESDPERMEVWRLGDATTVLWISSVTHTLHIEADKSSEYAKNILTKPILIKFLRETNCA